MKTEAQLQEFLEAHKWTFAKTMPDNPHFWLHVESARSIEEFEDAVAFIQKEGIPERYYRSTYNCVYLNGWKYWTMGYPPDQTTIINRAKDEHFN